MTWYYVMAAQLEEDYALSASELPPSQNTYPGSRMNHIAFQYDYTLEDEALSNIEKLTSSNFITIGKCGKKNFKYIVVAPILQNGMALFGELNKFVTVSETRFLEVDQTGPHAFATVVGVPSEIVTLTIYTGKGTSTYTFPCYIGDSGRANLVISAEAYCF